MHAKPVAQYTSPQYPTRVELLAVPAVLQRHQPVSWQRDATMRGVVAFFLAVCTTGCHAPEPASPSAAQGTKAGGEPAAVAPVTVVAVPEKPTGNVVATPATPEPAAPLTPGALVVAPLFEHGEGRGASGCVVVAPPVFLPEDEAMAVLREELRSAGVQLNTSGLQLDEVVISQRRQNWLPGASSALVEDVPGTARPLSLDAVDERTHVAVEYVSVDEYFNLGGIRSGSSVQGFDIKDLASELVGKMRQSGRHEVCVGVFYDPVGRVDFRNRTGPIDWEKERMRAQEESKVALRSQVRDFVGWLRANGHL